MNDIQVRNRYAKEVQILIERLDILQEQIKRNEYIKVEIKENTDKYKKAKEKLQEIEGSLELQNTNLDILDKKIEDRQLELVKIDKEIVSRKLILGKINSTIQTQDIILENKKEYTGNKIKKLDKDIKDYQDKSNKAKKNFDIDTKQIKYEIKDLNFKHKELQLLITGLEDEETLKREDLAQLRDDYNELDRQYQELLELYIIKN